jgi:hypothetical protein
MSIRSKANSVRIPIHVIQFSILAIWLTAAACNPVSLDSGLATLDNLAAGNRVHTNMCIGSSQAARNIDVSDVFYSVDPDLNKVLIGKDIGTTLTALPQHFIDTFVAARGAIVVTKDVATLCSLNGVKGVSPYETSVTSCNFSIEYSEEVRKKANFKIETDGNFLVVHPDHISHGLIRAIGYMLIADVAKAYVSGTKSPGKFARLQAKLASSFIADVKFSDGVFNLKSLEKYLGRGADRLVSNNFARHKKSGSKGSFDPLQGLKISKAQLNQFSEYVAVDAFDSWYCNTDPSLGAFDPEVLAKIKRTKDLSGLNALTNTRKIMKEFFGNSYRDFQPINKYLSSISTKVSSATKTKASRQSGLQLGWFGSEPTQAEKKAAIKQKYDAYVAQRDGRPSTWEKVRHPLEDTAQRRRRINNENLRIRGEYLNSTRTDGRRVTEQDADNAIIAAAVGAQQGYEQGKRNIVLGTGGAVASLAVGAYGVGKTSYNEGLGAAGSQIADSYNQSTAEAGERLGKKYYDIQNNGAGPYANALQYALATGGETGIVGPAFNSLENGAAVIGERDAYSGRALSPQETAAIADDQGKRVAGGAILNAGVGAGLGKGVHALAHAPSRILTRTATSLARTGAPTVSSTGRLLPTTISRLAARGAAPTVQRLANATGNFAGKPLVAGGIASGEVGFKVGVVAPLEVAGHHEIAHGGDHGADQGYGPPTIDHGDTNTIETPPSTGANPGPPTH